MSQPGEAEGDENEPEFYDAKETELEAAAGLVEDRQKLQGPLEIDGKRPKIQLKPANSWAAYGGTVGRLGEISRSHGVHMPPNQIDDTLRGADSTHEGAGEGESRGSEQRVRARVGE